MKKFLLITLALPIFSCIGAAAGFSSYKGVWSSDSAEAVITDSICIFYCQDDSIMTAYLDIPTAGISSKTIFAKDGTVTTLSDNAPLDIIKTDRNLIISGKTLRKVEDVQTSSPTNCRNAIQNRISEDACNCGGLVPGMACPTR